MRPPGAEDEDVRTAVVEFQAFRGVQNEYVVKEFAAVDLSTRCFTVAFFAPPYELSRLTEKTIRTNEWLERRYHRLRWDDGYIPYTDVSRTIVQICANFTAINTKWSEKAAFLRVYHRNVIDLNEMNAPTASDRLTSSLQCPIVQHQDNSGGTFTRCALRRAFFYSEWLVNVRKQRALQRCTLCMNVIYFNTCLCVNLHYTMRWCVLYACVQYIRCLLYTSRCV